MILAQKLADHPRLEQCLSQRLVILALNERADVAQPQRLQRYLLRVPGSLCEAVCRRCTAKHAEPSRIRLYLERLSEPKRRRWLVRIVLGNGPGQSRCLDKRHCWNVALRHSGLGVALPFGGRWPRSSRRCVCLLSNW